MELTDLIKHEEARSVAYKNIAACYYLPAIGLHKTLIELQEHIETLDSEAFHCVGRMGSEFIGLGDEIDGLCVDYARLFVGPYALLAPPYGSVYLDGERKVMGNSTSDVRSRYREAGLEISAGFKEPPDHIAAELEFMHFLVFKEVEAALNDDMDRAIEYVDQQRSFLSNHLAAWVPRFTHRVRKSATTTFYKNLARATDLFICHEVDHIFSNPSGPCADKGQGPANGKPWERSRSQ